MFLYRHDDLDEHRSLQSISSSTSTEQVFGQLDNDIRAEQELKVISSDTLDLEAGVCQERDATISSVRPEKKGWKAISGVMFCEFVGLSCLSLPSAVRALGWAGSILTIVVIWSICTYTSHILWQFCLAHPGEIRSVGDIARKLSNGNRFVVWSTICMLLCCSVSVGAIHTQISGVILNTLTNHASCTVVFTVVGALVSCALSMSRKFSTCGTIGLMSAASMAFAVLLNIVFLSSDRVSSGVASIATTTIWAPSSDFADIFNGVLTVSFSFVGQMCIPSLIDEMERPEDFGKALYTVQISLLAFFVTTALVVYSILGAAIPSPVVSALSGLHAKIVFGLTIPADICVGALFCFVAVKFLVDELFTREQQSDIRQAHRIKLGWISSTVAFWTLSFLIAELIPFFDQLITLMSAIFSSFFGFILWAWCYFHLHPVSSLSLRSMPMALLNICILLFGVLFLLGGGCSSAVGIVREFQSGLVGSVFSCTNNGVS